MTRDEDTPPVDPDVEQADEIAMYSDMSAAIERFGLDYAPLYWTTHRCANCSTDLMSPKFAALTSDKRAVVCLECRTRMAQDDFFAKVLAA